MPGHKNNRENHNDLCELIHGVTAFPWGKMGLSVASAIVVVVCCRAAPKDIWNHGLFQGKGGDFVKKVVILLYRKFRDFPISSSITTFCCLTIAEFRL